MNDRPDTVQPDKSKSRLGKPDPIAKGAPATRADRTGESDGRNVEPLSPLEVLRAEQRAQFARPAPWSRVPIAK